MKVVAPITEVYGTPRVNQKRRVEKPNGSSGLGQETRPAPRPLMLNSVASEETSPSHFGTTSRVGDFDNAIPAPFIAQVIAQVLETKRGDVVSAMRAFQASSQWRMANSLFATRRSVLA
jgi:hypothetical protein